MTAKVELSLSVAKGVAPFELTGGEREMGPEDWAWRFLRLNEDYRKAFCEVFAKYAKEDTPSACEKKSSNLDEYFSFYAHLARSGPLVDEHICRERFGLSTWLPPTLTSLPKLGRDESWFAPLRSIVAEARFSALKKERLGYRLVHKHLESRCAFPSSEARGKIRTYKNGGRPWMDASVWFAVDCSIPPEGQLKTIASIAKRYAELMRQGDLSKHAFYQEEPVVKELGNDPVFAEMEFRCPFAATARAIDRTNLWRMMKLCLVGATSADIQACRGLLHTEHAKLVASGLAAPPFRERLKMALDGTHDGVGKDGNPIKAYVIIAECRSGGMKHSKDIVNFLSQKGAGSLVAGERFNWLDDCEERAILFDGYAQKADEYIRGGYKWLIHSQNPPKS